MTPKQQYEARKAERKARQEARELLGEDEGQERLEDILDRMATAFERIADGLEANRATGAEFAAALSSLSLSTDPTHD